MKATLLAVAMAFAAQGAMANDLEPVTVTKLATTVNLMPPIPPSGPTVYTMLGIEVVSSGCTKAEHFSVNVEKRDDAQYVTIVRETPDRCKAVSHPVQLELRSEDIEANVPVYVTNPLYQHVQTVH